MAIQNETNTPHEGGAPEERTNRYGTYYGSYTAPANEDSGFDLRGAFRFLRRRKSIILSVLLIGTSIAAIRAYNQVPVYTATAKLLVEGDRRIVDLGNTVSTNASSSVYYQIETEVKILQSRGLISGLVIDKYQKEIEAARADPSILLPKHEPKWTDAVFAYARDWVRENDWFSLDSAVAGDIAGTIDEVNIDGGSDGLDWQSLAISVIPDRWVEKLTNEPEDVVLLSPEQAANAVQNRRTNQVMGGLSVRRERDSFVINVRYTSPNKTEAASLANAVAEAYIDDQLAQKKALTAGANDYLEQRLIDLEGELRRAELAVDDFIRDNDAVNPASLGVGGQEIANLSGMLVEARATRKERATRLRFIAELRQGGESLESLTEVLQSPYVQSLWEQDSVLRQQEAELRALYNDQYPTLASIIDERADIRSRLEIEIDRIVTNLQNELQVARERETSIQSDIDQIISETGSAGQSEIELRRLEREAAATRSIYENFLQRYKETREQQELVEANARIIQRAEPPFGPSSGSPNRALFMGAGLSLALGLGLAFIREKLDNGVRSGKEIEAVVGLPYLGLTPHLTKGQLKGKKVHQHMLDKPMSAYTETIRQLYTVIRLSNIDNPPQVVQVTSSVPQEGKTTISVSLAVALAMDGKKVVLVDGDLRHPSVQREIDMGYEACLVDYLAGDSTLNEALVQDETLGIDILPVRRLTPNPARLLASGRMADLLERLRSEYDFVIVDGPPVLGMSDSKVLMETSDCVLFVARWEKTTMDTVVDAVSELQGCNADIVGIVMTQVNISKQGLYGYGGIDAYYGKYYNYYRN